MFNRNIRMSTTDNKIKIQLRPTLPGSGPGIINRPDKNPSPSKLMINHGKPNYTINRTTNTLSPKNKPSTTETVTSPSLAFPLKPTNNPLSPVPSTASVGATSSTTNQIEKVILKHVPSTINVNSNSEPITYSNKPSVVSPVNSFVSPGISSKAAATSFGVKLKQCNNKKNIQNGDIPTTNGRDQNQSDEPEFVRRQKQIFEKLQLREQQQQQQQQHHQVETNTITTKTEINSSNDSINNDNNYQQNGHSNTLNNNSSIKQTNGYHSQEKTTTIIDSHVKNVTNRLENVSSTINSNINNSNIIDQQKSSSQQQNNSFKLPPGAICGKPAIPGKPANLQIPPSAARYQQQNNLLKNQNNSINSNNDLSTTVTSNTETTTTTATTQKPITPTVNENNFVDNSIGVNFEQKTIVSFSKDLSTEPNRYPDTVKITKTISNGNGINKSNDTINFNEDDVDDDDEGLKEFIAIEKTSKLAEEMAQIKFDIKTDEEDVTITPVVIR
ncbi:probable serine/threonine-protein kinase cdc7 isoform X2 [Condylostylus longicornis]|uniref:probable serine/threonine-protein kinase cdc7 isoform X2 n=1 Tax=Condylostylus longicornis TaxID=2530218 RepID=UPI00244E199E|nr:probable serine/threonine-protein kinase cdc7 isoform X2 [Condylostylus longicornis]